MAININPLTHMKKYTCLCRLFLFMILLSSCTQYAYYQSPFQANTASYKAMPLYSDSIRSAVYASGAFITGGANSRYRDGLNAGVLNVYRSHTSQYLQAFYGFTGIAGNYHVEPYTGNVHNRNLDTADINRGAGGYFWGGWGISGGISAKVPFNKHEWRLGSELSWQRESGKLLDLRKQLPDSAANLIERRKNYMTLSFGSDWVFHIYDGAIGYKIAYVMALSRLRGFDSEKNPFFRVPGYLSQTFHVTIRRITGYTQFNFGTYAMNFQFGLNYRLMNK